MTSRQAENLALKSEITAKVWPWGRFKSLRL